MSKKSDEIESEKEKYSQEQLEKFYDKLKREQEKELTGLQGKVKGQKFQELETLMRDKSTLKQEGFEKQKNDQSQKKQAGVSTGYITRELASGDAFMLKHFYQKPGGRSKQEAIDRRDAVHELMGSTLYERLLNNRTPREAIVKGDKDHPGSLYIRSKFFKGAKQLAEFSTGKIGFGVNPNDRNLKKLEGFEKVIAACHMLGEGDYHAGNLMVQGNTVVKIDHGRSFMAFPESFDHMINKTHERFSSPNKRYSEAIEKGNLSFDVRKYSKALSQMTKQLDNEQIDNIVNQRIADLKKSGLVLSSDEFGTSNHEKLAEFYRDKIKANLNNMKEIAKQVEIITKFGDNPPARGFKEGKWLKAFAQSKIKDPVLYAVDKGIKIDGLDAVQWAKKNNYQFKSPNQINKSFIYAEDLELLQKLEYPKHKSMSAKVQGFANFTTKDPLIYAICSGAKIDGKSPLEWAQGNGYKVKSEQGKTIDPAEYLVSAAEKTGQNIPESAVKFMAEAASLGLKTSDGKPFSELLERAEGYVENREVTRRLKDKNESVAEGLMSSIDQFTKQSMDKPLTSKKVEKFYEGLMTTLKKEGHITEKDIANIKANPNYQANIENTKNLLNSQGISGLPRSDKLCYKVSGFCKSLGLAKLSDHFIKKIPPENLSKIRDTEQLIAKTLQIQESLLGKSGVQQSLGAKKIELTEKVVQNKLNARAKKHEQRGR